MVDIITQILNSPKLFNYIIMLMYMASAARWFYHYHVTSDSMSYAHACYWLSALAITAVVTFLYRN